MAEVSEMKACNPDVELSNEEFLDQMAEIEGMDMINESWQGSLDEIWTQPDVLGTSFYWQVQARSNEGLNIGEWEEEEPDEWHYLPSFWQRLLNNKLSEHHSAIQDCEILFQQRLQDHGPDDVKTKNAKKKLESIQKGETAVYWILICKRNGKEASPDVYKRAISKSKDALSVNASKQTDAYKFKIEDLTLTLVDGSKDVDDEESMLKVRQLRIVSVTARSRQLQELRVHLSALSLSTAHLLPGASSSGASDPAEHHSHDKQAKDQEHEQKDDQKEMEVELQAIGDAEEDFPCAGEALVEHLPNDEMHNAETCAEPMEAEEDGKAAGSEDCKVDNSDSDMENYLEDLDAADAVYECKGAGSKLAKSMKAPEGTFKNMAAYQFLDGLNLTEVPNISGCSIGVHCTIKCWQVRYPTPEGQETMIFLYIHFCFDIYIYIFFYSFIIYIHM